MADDDTRTTTPEEPLAWEARNARRAAYAAIAAAVLSLVGNVLRALVENGFDRSAAEVQTIVDTLGRAAAGRPPVPGAASAFAEYIGTHTAGFLLAAVLLGAGGLLIFLPLAYLFRAVRARVRLSPIGLVITAVGAAGYGIGQLLLLVATVRAAADFADGTDRSNAAANDALGDSTAAAAQLVRDLGGLALAIAFVIICLNAMRAGLLTRLMGVLGAFVGASFVLGIDQLGVLRAFWLLALAALILGLPVIRRPPAWAVAEAVPWPSQQEVREQREAARRARQGERAGGKAAADAPKRRAERVPQPRAPEPRRAEPAGARPHSASKKRKRKRRS